MTLNDLDYYQRRERQEREFAARSVDSTARRAHLQMADRYLELLERISESNNDYPLPQRAALGGS